MILSFLSTLYRKPERHIKVLRPYQYGNMKYSPMPRQCYDQASQVCYIDACLPSPGVPSQLKCLSATVLFGWGGCGGSKTSSLTTPSMVAATEAAVMSAWEKEKRFKGTDHFPVKTLSIVQSELLLCLWQQVTLHEKGRQIYSKKSCSWEGLQEENKALDIGSLWNNNTTNKTSPIHILNWQPPKGWHSLTCCLVHFQFM